MEISHVIEIFHFHHGKMPSQVVNKNAHLPDEADIAFQRLWWIFTKCRKIPLCCIPKPHGSGWICPHSFQRPITQKVLNLKKSAKNTYSTENFC
jgi:hypothetical protein